MDIPASTGLGLLFHIIKYILYKDQLIELGASLM